MDEVRKEILLKIQSTYNYTSSQEVVSHYLKRVYPDPEVMNAEDKAVYNDIQSSLVNLLQDQLNTAGEAVKN